ncbi:C39 family peptidase [Caldibacillus debilis]|uniref:C39 family peptidase n=1 Tax=Caldibacillus debilis TaxID=301148 RepID=UPI00036696E5|nr:C39 family peptidase [Caldibacillus debilis]
MEIIILPITVLLFSFIAIIHKNRFVRLFYFILTIIVLVLTVNVLPEKIPEVQGREEDPVPVSELFRIADDVFIDVPVISQLPELQRGCEVTSLAMLLNFAGADVDKMELAEKIKKVPFTYKKGGQIYSGHPNDGFVGDIRSWKKPGLGAYHRPVYELAARYLQPGQAIDLTGENFEKVKLYLSHGKPVWVITNTEYRKLPDSYFRIWNTEKGKIKITYKEHSVLLTGYDPQYVYFNDPLTGKKRKAPLHDFIASWEQMGRQAITYGDRLH